MGLMNNAIKFGNNKVTITLGGGEVLTYSPKTDKRIEEVIDGKIVTFTLQGAETLASEIRCWGAEAKALGWAVQFWS